VRVPRCDVGTVSGFSFRERKSGEVHVLHHGARAATLRGERAQRFLVDVERTDAAGAQHLMARATGNYKRGNERQAASRPRRR
jgi:hypothetical protein